MKSNRLIPYMSARKMAKRTAKGFTLIEFLVVSLIIGITALTIGPAFVKLSTLEDLNREKAVTLEKLCDRLAWTQPYVAVGAVASNTSPTRVDIAYPQIVFGIACETNRFAQVTNCTIMVRNDGVLQTVIQAGKVTGIRSVTNAMDWMDPLVSKGGQPVMSQSAVTLQTNGVVMLSYAYNIIVSGATGSVALTVPIKMRNDEYQ